MKILDFTFLVTKRKEPHSRPIDYAIVTIEKGFLFWKKVEKLTIYKELAYWKYLDTGEFCEEGVEKMADANDAKQLLDNHKAKL